MRALQIIIVIWSVKICRHTADKIIPILPLIKFTHLKPCNLCNRIRLVCLLKRSREQCILRYRLRRHPRINTGAAQKQELLYLIIMAAFDYIALYLHILVRKLRGRRIVRVDTAHLCGCKDHDIRTLRLKKSVTACWLVRFNSLCVLPIIFV